MDNERSDVLELGAKVSALLFSQGKPVSLSRLAEATGAAPLTVESVVNNLRALYKEEVHGFTVEEVAGGYQFRTSPLAAEAIRQLLPPRARRLSRAALETLAVVAYKQPVQRAEIEAIRGVDALPTLKTLMEAKLVRTVGHDEAIGQPVLYATTDRFLERFGLGDLEDLPSLRELEEVLSDPGEDDTPSDTEGESRHIEP